MSVPRAHAFLPLLLVAALGVGCDGDSSTYDGPPIEVVPSPAPEFPLVVDASGRRLVDQRGTPFFLNGDAAWSLISGARREDVDLYLQDRRARGVDAIVVVLIDHTDPLQNAYGEAPFLTPGDFTTPNPAYFEHADWVVRRAAQEGMLVWLSPIYLGFGGGDEGFYQDALAAGPPAMRAWGRFVGERYRDVDGLVWLMGGDYAPPAEGLSLLAEVVAGIEETDDRHLFAAHWSRGISGWEIDVPWIDVNTTYTRPPVYVEALEDRAGRVAPLVLLEAVYENEQGITAGGIRAQAYHAILAGSIGHFFGSWPVWKFAPGWQQGLSSLGAAHMTHLRNLFVERAWWTLEPDTSDAVLVEGRGAVGTEDYVMFARDPATSLAIAYLPTSRALGFDLSARSGAVRARWFDPTSGAFRDASPASLPAASGGRVAAPGRNGAGDDDWVLVLESVD